MVTGVNAIWDSAMMWLQMRMPSAYIIPAEHRPVSAHCWHISIKWLHIPWKHIRSTSHFNINHNHMTYHVVVLIYNRSIISSKYCLLSLSKLCIHGLVQERRNSSVSALELRLSCTNPSVCFWSLLWLQICVQPQLNYFQLVTNGG